MPDVDVDEVARLIGDAQIQDVRCLHLSAQAVESGVTDTETPAKLQLKVRQEPDHIAVHGRIVLDTGAARDGRSRGFLLEDS